MITRAPRRGDAVDEAVQAGGGEVLDRHEADASRGAAGRQLDRAGDEHLAPGAASLASPAAGGRTGLGAQRDLGFVDLDEILQKAAIGRHHGAAKPLQQEPCGLVAAEAELGLQLQGGNAVGVARHDMGGHEPGLQREMAAVHDRAGGHRGLPPAGRTFPRGAVPLQFPALHAAAARTDEALRPAPLRQMPRAGVLVGEPPLEGGARHRAVVLPTARHAGTLREHTAPVNAAHQI